MVERDTFLSSSPQCPPLFALCLLVKVCRIKSTQSSPPPSVRATVQLPLRCSFPPSPPLLRCMCWLSSLPPPPLSADLLLCGQESGLLLSYPRLPSALLTCGVLTLTLFSPSLSLSFTLSLSLAVFPLALIISFSPSFSFFSQAKGDKLHLLVSTRSH